MSDDDRNITPKYVKLSGIEPTPAFEPNPCGIYWKRADVGSVEIGGCYEMYDGAIVKVGTALHLSLDLVDQFIAWYQEQPR